MKVTPASPKSSIDRFVSDDCVEGAGSFEIFFRHFPKRNRCISSQSGGDYHRSDLSFHPLGSIWVKGNKNIRARHSTVYDNSRCRHVHPGDTAH